MPIIPMEEIVNYSSETEHTDTGGAYRLWLAVFTDAVETLKHPEWYQRAAREFLFDESNQFFNYVCQVLEYEPESLRKQIRKAVER